MLNATVETDDNGRIVKIKGHRVAANSAYELGLMIEAQAKSLAPIDTGRLAGSITTQSRSEGTTPQPPATTIDTVNKPTEGNVAVVGTNVEYAPYVEFGTIRTPAQPFMRPALDLARGRVLTVVERNGRREFAEYLQ